MKNTMLTKVRRGPLVALALVVAAMMLAAPASALTWNSSSSPLKVTEDGVTQGSAYGDFVSNSVALDSKSTRKDNRAGGDGVYVETGFYFYRGSCSTGDCTVLWRHDVSKQTARTTSGSWVSETRSRNLRADSDRGRGQMKVCEDQSWSGDPCSSTVIKTLSY